jgi:hypothetical protein
LHGRDGVEFLGGRGDGRWFPECECDHEGRGKASDTSDNKKGPKDDNFLVSGAAAFFFSRMSRTSSLEIEEFGHLLVICGGVVVDGRFGAVGAVDLQCRPFLASS